MTVSAYEQARQVGFDALLARAAGGDASSWAALGAVHEHGMIVLSALNRRLRVDLAQREVWVEDADGGPVPAGSDLAATPPRAVGTRARAAWAVLALHYACAGDVAPDAREVSFSHFADCRSYLAVFGKRIVGRFLATAGRTDPEFARRSESVGGVRLPGSGVRYQFHVLPRVPIAIVRYEGDAELAPGASVVYRADAERLLPAEDRVVAAELLLDALAGKLMGETEVPHERRL